MRIEPDQRENRTAARVLVAVLIGLAGSLAIWLFAPYNNFVLNNSFVSDSYLPVLAMFLMLVLVAGVNPVLHRLAPRSALRSWQLAIIFGVLLVASVVPGQGLLRQLPYTLASVTRQVGASRDLAARYHKMNLPPGLFPGPMQYGQPAPAAEAFITELPAGAPIPWSAWVGPAVSWGAFLIASWVMMLGLAMIVTPQWRLNERLAFPLLTVERSMIEEPGEGRFFAPLFRSRAFWIAAAVIFLVHFLIGVNQYRPDIAPRIPIGWDLTSLLNEPPWSALAGSLRKARVYFMLVGVTFFMPNRVGFSIWFTVVAYGVYRMIGYSYFPPFDDSVMLDHRDGAMLAIALVVLFIGRAHWARVLGGMFARASTPAQRRDRKAAWLLMAGLAGMFAWMCWVGVSPVWSLLLVGFAFIICLVISRVVAETGMPFIRMYAEPVSFMRLVPGAWLSPITLWMGGVVAFLFPMSSRVNPAAMMMHGTGLDEQADPRYRLRLGYLFLGVLVLGVVVSGMAHLVSNYRHGSTMDPTASSPINLWGTQRLDETHRDMSDLDRGGISPGLHSASLHLGLGAGAALLLYWACLTMPRWPLHPIGLLLIRTNYGDVGWASIMVGWTLKILLVSFGGARLYRRARPVFLGLIIGEVLAAVFWALTPAILVWLNPGLPYVRVQVTPT
ncbi:MAG: hypothetical protein BIFFINMI_00798 [Phycisphaerae bacterium]|nr:hypothetical protein [Phycisphaerae bacterium]